jgi:hypothetical protein
VTPPVRRVVRLAAALLFRVRSSVGWGPVFVAHELDCQRCRQRFPFGVEEQAQFAALGFVPPKRCLACRTGRRRRQRTLGTSREQGGVG